MDTRLYVMTHKEYTKPDDDMYISMHVGHALGNDFGYQADDTGDNISAKNRNYCELTGLYWIWKNVTCDIVGICHYRRYFVRNEGFLTQGYIEEVLGKYDVIAPNSNGTPYGTNFKHYEANHHGEDMMVCRDVIAEKYQNYLDAFDLCMNTSLASFCNMLITRKSVFDEYCEWLFDILFEVERRVDISGYDAFQARIFGYLSERLLRVWLMANTYKVKEEEVRMIDPVDSENAVKKVGMVHDCLDYMLADITKAFSTGTYFDIYDTPKTDIDFNGKIPVFVCWWQGLDNAPDVVQKCIYSIDRNVPADIAEVHLITLENVGLYITFPEWIVEKYESGVITMTQLSDILRVALLYHYGGMWIDATYYATGKIPADIFSKELWTIKHHGSEWRADIVQGRWSGNCIEMKRGNLLARFVLNAFYYYWRINDKLLDYYMIDYLIAIAYENIEAIRKTIDECEYSNPQSNTLIKKLNDTFSQGEYDSLTAETFLHKLTYKLEYRSEDILGRPTYFKHVLTDEEK